MCRYVNYSSPVVLGWTYDYQLDIRQRKLNTKNCLNKLYHN